MPPEGNNILNGKEDQEYTKVCCQDKILKNTRKYIRYSQKKETEVELLIYFCSKLNQFNPPVNRNSALRNLYDNLMASIRKTMLSLHEDLQYDYGRELEELHRPD